MTPVGILRSQVAAVGLVIFAGEWAVFSGTALAKISIDEVFFVFLSDTLFP